MIIRPNDRSTLVGAFDPRQWVSPPWGNELWTPALNLADSTNDRIEHGTALGSGFTAASWFWWYYPTTLTSLNVLTQLFTGSFGVPSLHPGVATDELRLIWRRGSGGTNAVYETNNANITVNKWWCVGVTFDQGAAAGAKGLWYLGDLTTPMTVRTNGTATDPATFLSNSGSTFIVGGTSGSAVAAGSRIAVLMFWPGVVLTQAEFQAQQFSAVPVKAGAHLCVYYGVNGTGRQIDATGRGNHGTVTTATYAQGPPSVGQLWDVRRRRVVRVPDAPAGIVRSIFRSPIFRSPVFRSA